MDRINTTEKEYKICRDKIKNLRPPFIKKGDAGTNSPGEWERIIASAESLNPSSEIWKKPNHYKSSTGQILLDTGPIRQGATGAKGENVDPKTEGINAVNAAFAYQMTGEEKYLKAVQEALSLQMNEPVMNFADPAIWKPFSINDINPGFIAAEWVTRYLKAYVDTYETYPDSLRKEYDDKFKDAGHYFSNEVNHSLDQCFVDRENGDYTLKLGTKPTGEHLYDDGPEIMGISKFYNNRRATMMKLAAYVGAFYKDEKLMNSSYKFFKEWLTFAVYPNGMLGENERASKDSQESGFAYSMGQLCVMVEIADVLYRAGRKDLMFFETSDGYVTTKGGLKSIFRCAQSYLSMFNGTLKVTAYGEILNGIEVDRGWYSVQDVILASNMCLYFNDPIFKDRYLRREYPANPAGNGAVPAYMGAGGTLASYLLVKAGLNGRIEEMLAQDTLSELKLLVPGSEEAQSLEEIVSIVKSQAKKERDKEIKEGALRFFSEYFE